MKTGLQKNMLLILVKAIQTETKVWPGAKPRVSTQIYAPGPEILAKTSKIMQVWFGNLIFGTFCLMSGRSCPPATKGWPQTQWLKGLTVFAVFEYFLDYKI